MKYIISVKHNMSTLFVSREESAKFDQWADEKEQKSSSAERTVTRVNDLMSNMAGVKISCNINVAQLDLVKQFYDAPHGASILSNIMLDLANRGIDVIVTFSDPTIFNMYVNHLPSVWKRCKSDNCQCIIRSYKYDGEWTDRFDAFDKGKDAYTMIERDNQYGNKKNIIEIQHVPNKMFSALFMRWNDPTTRKLTLMLSS
jgi:hypothetical protein